MRKIIYVVWDGVDSYYETTRDDVVYTRREKFTAMPVEVYLENEMPLDEFGERDWNGFGIADNTGTVFKF